MRIAIKKKQIKIIPIPDVPSDMLSEKQKNCLKVILKIIGQNTVENNPLIFTSDFFPMIFLKIISIFRKSCTFSGAFVTDLQFYRLWSPTNDKQFVRQSGRRKKQPKRRRSKSMKLKIRHESSTESTMKYKRIDTKAS